MHEGRVEPIDVTDRQAFEEASSTKSRGAMPDGRPSAKVRDSSSAAGVLVVKGQGAVLAWVGRLKELAARYGQAGAADDLPYHLSTRFAENKIPTLVLIRAGCACGRGNAGVYGGVEEGVEGFEAAVLLFEYRIFGIRSRLYSTADVTGRRTVIGPEDRRAGLAAFACRSLMERGAEIVLLSLQTGGTEQSTRSAFEGALGTGRAKGTWSLVERETPLYLPLRSTFDETLAAIGKKTRTNLRYYRRRAEKELGCRFVPEVKLGLDEFVKVSLEAAFPVEREIARWRYESLARIEDPLFCGVLDGNGRWLSLAAGRRSHGHVELDWQSNRPDLPLSSLSTVLRSYLIEYEVGRGSTRLYIEGTRSHLQHSFMSERIADVTLCRRSLPGLAIRKLAGRLFPERIQLAQVLRDKTIVWERW